MSDIIIYLVKVNLILAICYGVYRLCSQGSTFFQLHRIMLWAIYILAATLPFVHWDLGLNQATVQGMAASYVTHVHPSEWPIFNAPQLPVWSIWFLAIYELGVLLLYIRFMIQLGTLLYMGVTSSTVNIHGRLVHIVSENKSPFSFFRWIFMDPQMHTEEEIHSIMMHEEAHVSQKHSLDILWAELVSIIFWFNPFVWLMKREIRTNLEFLADNEACQQVSSVKEYQYHLLGLACEGKHQMLVNRLNMAPLKKRVLMMNKRKSLSSRGWRYLLFVPVVVILGLVSHLDILARNIESTFTDNPVTHYTYSTIDADGHPNSVKTFATEFFEPTSPQEFNKTLVIVDGTIYKKDLSTISPERIKSIDVLKGKYATDAYGNKAKNGVMVLTLKHN